MLVVDVDPSGASTQACDLRIAGTEPDAEVIAKIAALVAERHITACWRFRSAPGRDRAPMGEDHACRRRSERNRRLHPAKAVSLTMQAIVHRQYGAPEVPAVLAFETIARPVPGEDDVLVRVHAAGASVGDHHVITGKPYLIRLSPFGGPPRPRNRMPGAAMAGRGEAVGAKVGAFRPGDEVFGQAANGAFAEYLVMPAKLLAPKPSNLSFEEAAAMPLAATALQGLRDAGGLKAGQKAGQKVLINGASGGVGTWAAQIAKALGADVTAVCSTRNVEMVRALGADAVVDYTVQNFVTSGTRFDVILALVGNRSLSDCRSVLTPKGAYVLCSGGGGDWVGPFIPIVGSLLSSLFTTRRFRMFVMTPNRDDLLFLKGLVEAGKARPVIERRYALSEVGER
jgi:NADPH:quinone reductase-like Zn-dependent oxidoreductase